MENKELKGTLLLPKTNFPIRKKEGTQEKIALIWEEKQVYKRCISSRKQSEKFVVHDGPPYANGSIHVGHFVNRILKDVIVRFHNLLGFQTFFKLGWDTHGLPIEFRVLNAKEKIQEKEIREACRKYANEQIEVQRNQLKKLGLFNNYQDNYSTGDHSYEAEQLHILAEVVEKGLIHRGLRPIYWSWSHRTALAENEVEYREREDFSLFFKFELVDNFFEKSSVKLLVWTTQPWTIPGNVFAGINPKSDYLLVSSRGELFIFSEEYTEKISDKEIIIIKSFKGNILLGLRYVSLYKGSCEGTIIDAGSIVKTEEGTGVLHLAPACGPEDFLIAQREGVEVNELVDEKGCFFKESPVEELAGVFYQKANQWIINDLEKRSLVHKWGKFLHSYPHDWRDKSPLIYRLTSQWFIDLKKIRQNLLDNIEKVEWVPAYSKDKMISFIKNRNDWCISRQRKWGVPIPVVINSGKAILDTRVIRFVAEIVKREGSDFWFQERGLEMIKERFSSSFGKEVELGTDTLDVWFDSGASSLCVLNKEGNWPADVYLEGSDQFRGWFNSSLILSTIVKNSPPYKKVVSHGFTVDEHGRKMSKSLGNTVDPLLLIEKFGIDTLRLWVASVDFTKEVKIGNEILLNVNENYQKLRNCLRFIVASLHSGEKRQEEGKQFSTSHGEIDQVNSYIRECLEVLDVETRDSYLNYNFANIYNLVNNFCVNKLSTFYFEIIKDILYCDSINSRRRKSILQTLNEVLKKMLVIITPILPFLSEEIYQTISDSKDNFTFEKDEFYSHESICFIRREKGSSDYPQLVERTKSFDNSVLSIRKEVFKELEKARQQKIIETNQQAVITLLIPRKKEEFGYSKLISDDQKEEDLSLFFVVSKVVIEAADDFSIKIEKTHCLKCKRCWRFVIDENSYQELCRRCTEAII